MDKISIVVAVYNAEKTLKKCVIVPGRLINLIVG